MPSRASPTPPVLDVVVVGQTPPPQHGQAIMIRHMLDAGGGPNVRFHHVRLAFSETIADVGRPRAGKLLEALRVIARVVAARFRHGATVLYYPPAPPRRVPLVRDLMILIPTRWLFQHTVFHFHAGGLSDLIPALPAPLRWACALAYGSPDAVIRTSSMNPEDGKALRARREYVVPNCVEDQSPAYRHVRRSLTPEVLYVGRVSEAKGALVALEACRQLRDQGRAFHLSVIGGFESAAFEAVVASFVRTHRLESHVTFLGELTGAPKWESFARAWMLCFPTHFEGESFGLVALEAMSFGLPVVATHWRGVPSVVVDGETGFLVPVKDAVAVADRIGRLLDDADLRTQMGERGRARFHEHFTPRRFFEGMRDVFETLRD